MRNLAIAIVALAAASCSASDPRQAQITADLLEDQSRIASISNRLPPDEREMFGNYVASRTFVGPFSKPITNERGEDPATVGEAIELMREIKRRNERLLELEVQREAEIAPLRAELERLAQASEAARWAPPQVREHNAMVDRINAVQERYRLQIERLMETGEVTPSPVGSSGAPAGAE